MKRRGSGTKAPPAKKARSETFRAPAENHAPSRFAEDELEEPPIEDNRPEDNDVMEGDVPDEPTAPKPQRQYNNPAVISGGRQRKWGITKPEDPGFNQNQLLFQEIDTDYALLPARRFSKFTYDGRRTNEVPVLRMYGMTKVGRSVCCHLWGFEPYFYVQIPPGFNTSRDSLEEFRKMLERFACEKKKRTNDIEYITRIELALKTSLFKYQTARDIPFFKIFTGIPGYVPMLRDILENGIFVPGIGIRNFQTFESNVLFVLRCMVDATLVPLSWQSVTNFELRGEDTKSSYCDYELDCSYKDVKTLDYKTSGDIARFRILSFDIECLGYTESAERGARIYFPEAGREECRVIVIANTLTIFGDQQPIQKTAFVLGGCSEISGSIVHSFETEQDLLLSWADYIREMDPDIITGYNIINFDIPYLLDRAEYLGKTSNMQDFAFLGRIRDHRTTYKQKNFQSKQMGIRLTREIPLKGRVIMDVMNVILRDHKLSSYRLNNVSSLFLGEQKEDVHYSMIGVLFAKDDDSRKRVASYCVKDAILPQRLIDKLQILYNNCEMSRVCGLSLGLILERGQQIKVVSQLLREALKRNLIMPTPTRRSQDMADDSKYTGATVLSPILGFYKDVTITTLDFASLYPSIMIAHNLCFSTLIDKANMDKEHPEKYQVTPAGFFFVKHEVMEGLLPKVLRNLLDARDQAKQMLKKATDPLEKAVLNGRQLALKISANSVYGFTGAGRGQLPCVPISSSVTAFGREMILATKTYVEDKYSTKNGFKKDSVVIYGDTDSVMVNFGISSLKESMELGKKAAKEVSSIFKKPIRLEFEKVYYPYLLLAKKHYAGVLWTNPDKFDKIDTKGIESVRRDKCTVVRSLITTALNLVLVKRNIPAVIRYIKQVFSALLMNKLDISMLMVSKTLSRPEYKNKQPHVVLAEKMAKRNPATAPKLGDRVQFVYVTAGGPKGKEFEKSEEPMYVLTNGIGIDCAYYLEKKIKPVIQRTFEYVLTKPQMDDIFGGKHTRKATTTLGKADGMMRYATIRIQCMSCKQSIAKGPVCNDCIDKAPKIYADLVHERNHFDNLYSKAWSYCHTCQNAFHQHVLCVNEDCPIFFMRQQVKIELEKAETKLQRFDELEW